MQKYNDKNETITEGVTAPLVKFPIKLKSKVEISHHNFSIEKNNSKINENSNVSNLYPVFGLDFKQQNPMFESADSISATFSNDNSDDENLQIDDNSDDDDQNSSNNEVSDD